MECLERVSGTLAKAALAASALPMMLAGCSWRTAESDHYFGPVLYRSSSASSQRANVNQVVRLGVSGEAGTTWGITIGISDRTLVGPKDMRQSEGQSSAQRSKPSPVQSAAGPDTEADQEWHFSPFYLKVEKPQDSFFVSRKSYGAEFVAGSEVTAASVGFARRTLFTPPDNAIAWIQFDIDQPLHTKAGIWRDTESKGVLPSSLKEDLLQ